MSSEPLKQLLAMGELQNLPYRVMALREIRQTAPTIFIQHFLELRLSSRGSL